MIVCENVYEIKPFLRARVVQLLNFSLILGYFSVFTLLFILCNYSGIMKIAQVWL